MPMQVGIYRVYGKAYKGVRYASIDDSWVFFAFGLHYSW